MPAQLEDLMMNSFSILQSRGYTSRYCTTFSNSWVFAEIINKLKNEDLEERLMKRIDDELAKAGE